MGKKKKFAKKAKAKTMPLHKPPVVKTEYVGITLEQREGLITLLKTLPNRTYEEIHGIVLEMRGLPKAVILIKPKVKKRT